MGQVFGVVRGFLVRLSVPVVLGQVSVKLRFARDCYADRRSNAPPRLLCLLTRHDAVCDLTRAQRVQALLDRDLSAPRREDRGYVDQVEIGDAGVAQGSLERRQLFFVDAFTARKEDASRDDSHGRISDLPGIRSGHARKPTFRVRNDRDPAKALQLVCESRTEAALQIGREWLFRPAA